jgi:hypothetical protein
VHKGALFPKCELACSDNTHDCYIHSLINLKFIPPEFARPLSKYLQINQTGVGLKRWEILESVWPEFEKDNNYMYTNIDIENIEAMGQDMDGIQINYTLEQYYQEMPDGFGIEITIDYQWPYNDRINHSVVLYKKNNQLHIEDSQIHCRNETISNLLTNYYNTLKYNLGVKFYGFLLTIAK